VRRALRLLEPRAEDRVIDFFCGLGNFTLPLARRAACVVGIEGSAPLLERAARAAQVNGLGAQTRFEQRDLFGFTHAHWKHLQDGLGSLDLVLVGPPREGAIAVAQALAQAAQPPRRAVYVSCNPATLARDCAVLHHEGGWSLRAAGVVNMFPHTSHVESIAVLEPPRAASE